MERVGAALMKYPEEYRTEVFGKFQKALPIERAVEVPAPTFCSVAMSYGKDAAKFWLRFQIASTFAVIGIYDQIDAAQVRAVADDILSDEIYGQFTLAEFLSFLSRFRMGRYGKIYSTNRPNMQEFLMALQPFWKDLQAERWRARIAKEQKERERRLGLNLGKEEYERMRKENYQAYLEMKKNGRLKNI